MKILRRSRKTPAPGGLVLTFSHAFDRAVEDATRTGRRQQLRRVSFGRFHGWRWQEVGA